MPRNNKRMFLHTVKQGDDNRMNKLSRPVIWQPSKKKTKALKVKRRR